MRTTPQVTTTTIATRAVHHRPTRRPTHGVHIPAEARRHARSTLFFAPSQRPALRQAPRMFSR